MGTGSYNIFHVRVRCGYTDSDSKAMDGDRTRKFQRRNNLSLPGAEYSDVMDSNVGRYNRNAYSYGSRDANYGQRKVRYHPNHTSRRLSRKLNFSFSS